MTGAPEAWYFSPYASHAALADSLQREAPTRCSAQNSRDWLVDPVQSYVPTETRAKDPKFWKKKPPTKPTTPQ